MEKYSFSWNQSLYNAGQYIIDCVYSEDEAIESFKSKFPSVDMRNVKWKRIY